MNSDAKKIDLLPNVEERKLYGGQGFVKLTDMMPRFVPAGRTADVMISRAARVSYQHGDKSPSEDANLVQYLMENRHTSPFEQVEFQFEIACPIFVERQLVRHRTASLNEASYRYSEAPDLFYYPDLRLQDTVNKQGSLDGKISEQQTQMWELAKKLNHNAFELYQELVKSGVAKEVARCVLPVAQMTRLVWKMDLHNLLHFLGLRMDVHAQKEIRDLACAIWELVKPRVPITAAAYEDFVAGAVKFSVTEQRQMRNELPQPGNPRKKEKLAAKAKALGIAIHKSEPYK